LANQHCHGRKKIEDTPASSDNARWSPDGKWIAYTGSTDPSGVSTTDLYLVPASGGSPKQLTAKFDLSAGTPVWSRDGKTLYFSTNVLEANEIFSADATTGSSNSSFKNRRQSQPCRNQRRWKHRRGTLRKPMHQPKSIIDTAVSQPTALTSHNRWMSDYTLAETDVVKWKSKDGMEIEGLLTRPAEYTEGSKVPFLLNPHGGPTGASVNSFNGTVQVLAANGFAVLQPNFRGSTGKGLAFSQANKNTWGKGDYEDCMTGVDAMIARGIADPDRLGAFGWSYGGYMTFWILTQTDRFKAVSPGAGLSNIYSMYSQNDVPRYLRWFYSDKAPWDATELLYWDRSPMKYVNNVKTPTLICRSG
jgi:dipeptidyl aminopeptidase/acylaminoacyl peptidase